MANVLALHWNGSSLEYVVAKSGKVVTAGELTLVPGTSNADIGRQLGEAIAPHVSGRTKTIVGVARSAVDWQHISLPPCPTEELPDLVRLQADREIGSSSEEDLGFDYFPLAGSAETPYEVLTVALDKSSIDGIRQVCRAANLTLERIIPLAFGWSGLTAQDTLNKEKQSRIFVAPFASEATLWATQTSEIILFRQFQHASADEQEAFAASIGSELRRTLLSLSQKSDFENPAISLVGKQQAQLATLAETLADKLKIAVGTLDVSACLTELENVDRFSHDILPLAGLACEESSGKVPKVDLLHPHRRPKAKVNYRTYSLAAIAATLLVATLGWSGYAALNAPLEKAAKDQAELESLEGSLEELAAYEEDAASVRNWIAETPNLLIHLQQLSKCIRPTSLRDADFPVDQDLALEKLNLEKRLLVIDAIARNTKAVQPFESRLRAAEYSPQRGKSGASKQEDYPWQFKSIIEVSQASDLAAENIANSEASEADSDTEPQS